MQEALTEFVQLLGGGVVPMGEQIGKGVGGFAESLFLEKSAEGAITGLSTYGGIVAILGGVSLAVGLTTRVLLWITSIGH